MLEVARIPACVVPCHTLVEDPAHYSMSDRKYSGSARDVPKIERRSKNPAMRDHRHASRSSADDPTVSSTRSSKPVSSNARNHPRAEPRDAETPHPCGRQAQGSPVVNHVSSKSNGGRKRGSEVVEEEEEGSVWVEHTSSSGRVYYYNKKNGVSQWERPSSMSKRTKTTDDPLSKHTPSSKHSSHPHSSSTHSHSLHTHSSHSHSRDHGNKELSGGGGHRSHSSSSSHHTSRASRHTSSHLSHHTSHSSQHHHDRPPRERDRGGHGSHRHSNRGSRSRSKSASVSPTISRGRGHHGKTTPNRHSRSHGSGGKRSVSPCTKQSHTTPSTLAVSPCTPSIPHAISQSLVATQQVINQTSAIIKHQQKLLSASGDPATPVTALSPTSSSSAKHSSHHPHARQKLLFNTVPGGQVNGPLLSPAATPVQNSTAVATEMSPQMIGMENLHPLQRALLLQQQQQQQATAQDTPAGQSTPGTPLPSAGGGATPLSQSIQAVTPPISALPPHLVSQVSHPGSPFSNSPSHTPLFATPPAVQVMGHPSVPAPYTPQGLPPNSQTPVYSYSMMMPANTPIAGIYMSDGGMLPAGGGGAYVTPGTTIPMRPPMSRLGRRRSTTNDEFSVFPDPGQVEPVVSGTNPELFSRTLSESWWSQPTENMHRQLDTSQHEVLSRRTTEALYLQGRLRRSQLSLDSTRVRATTRRERLLALELLMSEIDQR